MIDHTTENVTDEQTGGWTRVLEEMDAMAAKLADNGWETVSIAAGDAAAVTAETSRTGTHGFSYVVPGNAATAFEELFVADGFSRTEVYRANSPNHLYLLTVVKDPPTEAAVLIAGAIERNQLSACKQAATEAGKLYTNLLAVDGTCLGSFEHEDPTPFFPEE